MEDPWTQERVKMKLPIEEIKGRQQYHIANPSEDKREERIRKRGKKE